jgi:hypothetical protein
MNYEVKKLIKEKNLQKKQSNDSLKIKSKEDEEHFDQIDEEK